MGKKALAVLVILAALVGAWAVVREAAARRNAVEYLKKREIPTYHLLSLHSADERNLVGYCKPCGEKARAVIAQQLKEDVHEIEKKLEGK